MKRDNIVSTASITIKKIAPFANIILYGSEARGEARPDSDIDLLILIPNQYKNEYNNLRAAIADKLFEIELETSVLISPLVLLQEMWENKITPFTLNVKKDGIAL
ncbi:MAG: nucleotidyltransferase domain-containing protein [Muribaculaceae bacterium]|nr:nucleotidyltransferase domain-containing protein [Muribaculaceae bacterium]